MFKKYMIVMLAFAAFGQINAMKRALENAEIESLAKKMKVNDSESRESLFSFFEKNDLTGFKRESEWRKLYDKDSLNERNLSGETILFVVGTSKKMKNDEYFKILLDNGADINCANSRTNLTVLGAAAMGLNFERVQIALSAGADPNMGSADGVLPLVHLSSIPNIKFYPRRLEILNTLCVKTDLTKKDSRGNTIMHDRCLQEPLARVLLLNGGDIDIIGANNNKPFDACWVPETCKLLKSREVVRTEVIMPAMHQIAASPDNNKDNFPTMPNNVPKLVFNRQIIGPKDLNLNRLTYVGR